MSCNPIGQLCLGGPGYRIRTVSIKKQEGNRPPTPPLSHSFALSEKKVLMLT